MKDITQTELVITKDDMETIIEQRLIESYYVAYRGMGVNDPKEDAYVQERLLKYFLEILKAFFTPSFVLSDVASQDPTSDALMRGASMMKENDSNPDWWKRTDIGNAHRKTIEIIHRFKGATKENFEQYITALAFSRRLDILTKHFELPKNIVLSSLFQICTANNNNTNITNGQETSGSKEQGS